MGLIFYWPLFMWRPFYLSFPRQKIMSRVGPTLWGPFVGEHFSKTIIDSWFCVVETAGRCAFFAHVIVHDDNFFMSSLEVRKREERVYAWIMNAWKINAVRSSTDTIFDSSKINNGNTFGKKNWYFKIMVSKSFWVSNLWVRYYLKRC